jgi:hypothetical protein
MKMVGPAIAGNLMIVAAGAPAGTPRQSGLRLAKAGRAKRNRSGVHLPDFTLVQVRVISR